MSILKLIKTNKKDRFSRRIYIDSNDNTYVDIDLNDHNPYIHTTTSSGEPIEPLKEFKIVKSFK